MTIRYALVHDRFLTAIHASSYPTLCVCLCVVHHVQRIERAILLIRNPFDSIWSEYQRRLTQSHVGGIKKRGFDWPRWQANAAALSNAYHQMWAVHHAGIERHFAERDYLYVRYEDLRDKQRRVEALRRISSFLGIAGPSGPSEERLHCTFLLADNRQAHRKVDPELTMTKQEAYTQPLACRMWALFGQYASKHDYSVWAGFNCSEGGPYPPIPKVNVGPQGEYNRKWVKPGKQLMDFGGHPPSPPLLPSDTPDEGAGKGPPKGWRKGAQGSGGAKKQRSVDRRKKKPVPAAATAGDADDVSTNFDSGDRGGEGTGRLRESLTGQSVEAEAAKVWAEGNSPNQRGQRARRKGKHGAAQAAQGAGEGRDRGGGARAGPEEEAAVRRRERLVRPPAGGSTGGGGGLALAQGMNMAQATSAAVGAANVGLDKPAWQR